MQSFEQQVFPDKATPPSWVLIRPHKFITTPHKINSRPRCANLLASPSRHTTSSTFITPPRPTRIHHHWPVHIPQSACVHVHACVCVCVFKTHRVHFISSMVREMISKHSSSCGWLMTRGGAKRMMSPCVGLASRPLSLSLRHTSHALCSARKTAQKLKQLHTDTGNHTGTTLEFHLHLGIFNWYTQSSRLFILGINV